MLAERREPDSNGAVYDSVYMTSWKRQNSQNQTMDLCLSGTKEWNQRIGYRGARRNFLGRKNILCLQYGGYVTLFIKAHRADELLCVSDASINLT